MFATGLSQEARTQGKAAVDVAATQMGKAGGSLFQQALLVAFGSLGGALPPVRSNAKLAKGLFSDSLPPWMEEQRRA